MILRKLKDTSAQGTVEYAIVVAALLCIAFALAALMNVLDSGMFVQHALSAASHNITGAFGGIVDVFSY